MYRERLFGGCYQKTNNPQSEGERRFFVIVVERQLNSYVDPVVRYNYDRISVGPSGRG